MTPHTEITNIITEQLTSPYDTIRCLAVKALELINAENAESLLIPLLDDEDLDVVHDTINALASIKSSKLTPLLIERFRFDVEPQLIITVIKAVASNPDDYSIEFIEKILTAPISDPYIYHDGEYDHFPDMLITAFNSWYENHITHYRIINIVKGVISMEPFPDLYIFLFRVLCFQKDEGFTYLYKLYKDADPFYSENALLTLLEYGETISHSTDVTSIIDELLSTPQSFQINQQLIKFADNTKQGKAIIKKLLYDENDSIILKALEAAIQYQLPEVAAFCEKNQTHINPKIRHLALGYIFKSDPSCAKSYIPALINEPSGELLLLLFSFLLQSSYPDTATLYSSLLENHEDDLVIIDLLEIYPKIHDGEDIKPLMNVFYRAKNTLTPAILKTLKILYPKEYGKNLTLLIDVMEDVYDKNLAKKDTETISTKHSLIHEKEEDDENFNSTNEDEATDENDAVDDGSYSLGTLDAIKKASEKTARINRQSSISPTPDSRKQNSSPFSQIQFPGYGKLAIIMRQLIHEAESHCDKIVVVEALQRLAQKKVPEFSSLAILTLIKNNQNLANINLLESIKLADETEAWQLIEWLHITSDQDTIDALFEFMIETKPFITSAAIKALSQILGNKSEQNNQRQQFLDKIDSLRQTSAHHNIQQSIFDAYLNLLPIDKELTDQKYAGNLNKLYECVISLEGGLIHYIVQKIQNNDCLQSILIAKVKSKLKRSDSTPIHHPILINFLAALYKHTNQHTKYDD